MLDEPRAPKRIPPLISSRAIGDDVPIPIFPFASTVKSDDDVEILNKLDAPFAVEEDIERRDVGVVVPNPKLPELTKRANSPLLVRPKRILLLPLTGNPIPTDPRPTSLTSKYEVPPV